MTYTDLEKLLTDTGLFTETEILKIVRACGKFTVGNVIIAYEVLGIELTGHDVDIIIAEGG